MALVSCGFHLRGAGSVEFPEALATLRVVVEDSGLENDPLLVAAKEALRAQTKAQLVDRLDAPTLALFGERSDSQVLTVSASGRAAGYTLRYEVSFRVRGADGKELMPAQTVRLLRDYNYDPLNVLAKEQEERELRRAMQRDAVQQILRRLARYRPAVRS